MFVEFAMKSFRSSSFLLLYRTRPRRITFEIKVLVSRKNVAQIQTGGQVRSEGRECLGDAKTSDFGLCVGIVRCGEVNEWWRSPLGADDAGAAAVVDGWAGLAGWGRWRLHSARGVN